MNWKQVVPTDINDCENLTALERAIFFQIMTYTRHADGIEFFTHGGKHYEVFLKRGQSIFRKQSFADEIGINVRRITRGLDTLNKYYTKVETEAMPFGMIVTLKDFDELEKMKTEMETERKPSENRTETESRANKNVKNEKNVNKITSNVKKIGNPEQLPTIHDIHNVMYIEQVSEADVMKVIQKKREFYALKGYEWHPNFTQLREWVRTELEGEFIEHTRVAKSEPENERR